MKLIYILSLLILFSCSEGEKNNVEDINSITDNEVADSDIVDYFSDDFYINDDRYLDVFSFKNHFFIQTESNICIYPDDSINLDEPLFCIDEVAYTHYFYDDFLLLGKEKSVAIYDISIPSSPKNISNITIEYDAFGITSFNNTIAIISTDIFSTSYEITNSLQLLTISDKGEFIKKQKHEFVSTNTTVYIQNQVLYFIKDERLHMMDLRSENQFQITTFDIEKSEYSDYYRMWFSIYENYLYMFLIHPNFSTAAQEVDHFTVILDISSPTSPKYLGNLDDVAPLNIYQESDTLIFKYPDFSFYSTSSSKEMTISNNGTPELVNTYSTPNLSASRDYRITLDKDDGISKYKVGNSSSVFEIKTLSSSVNVDMVENTIITRSRSGRVTSLSLDNYTAQKRDNLEFITNSDPEYYHYLFSENKVFELMKRSKISYASITMHTIIDGKNESKHTLEFDFKRFYTKPSYHDNKLIIPGESEIAVLDIVNNKIVAPSEDALTYIGGEIKSVSTYNNFVAIINASNTLQLHQIAPNNKLNLLDEKPCDESLYALYLHDSFVYLISDSVLEIFQIKDDKLQKQGTIEVEWDISIDNNPQFQIFKNYLLVTDYTNGVRIIDISDPTMPSLYDTIEVKDTAMDVSYYNNHIVVADNESGIYFWKFK